jgi:hypothetical protein
LQLRQQPLALRGKVGFSRLLNSVGREQTPKHFSTPPRVMLGKMTNFYGIIFVHSARKPPTRPRRASFSHSAPQLRTFFAFSRHLRREIGAKSAFGTL